MKLIDVLRRSAYNEYFEIYLAKSEDDKDLELLQHKLNSGISWMIVDAYGDYEVKKIYGCESEYGPDYHGLYLEIVEPEDEEE